jgi:hypothetical protein
MAESVSLRQDGDARYVPTSFEIETGIGRFPMGDFQGAHTLMDKSATVANSEIPNGLI